MWSFNIARIIAVDPCLACRDTSCGSVTSKTNFPDNLQYDKDKSKQTNNTGKKNVAQCLETAEIFPKDATLKQN